MVLYGKLCLHGVLPMAVAVLLSLRWKAQMRYVNLHLLQYAIGPATASGYAMQAGRCIIPPSAAYSRAV